MTSIWRSFYHSFAGLWYALKNEQSFRIQVFLGMVVLFLILVLPLALWEVVVLLISIFMVLSMELINTTAEKIIDSFRPEITPQAKAIKDLMTAAVLTVSIGALIIGCLIFLPKIIALF